MDRDIFGIFLYENEGKRGCFGISISSANVGGIFDANIGGISSANIGGISDVSIVDSKLSIITWVVVVVDSSINNNLKTK